MTKPKRYKRYSVEFKREAIRRGSEEGTTDAAVWARIHGDIHFWVTRISNTMGMIELSGLKCGYLKVKSRGKRA